MQGLALQRVGVVMRRSVWVWHCALACWYGSVMLCNAKLSIGVV